MAPNILRRAGTFHFRRRIPDDLRQRIGRRELVCSLGTGDIRAAKLAACRLYVASEGLFSALRGTPMLTDDQIAHLVQDFYAYILDRENAGRLARGPLPANVREMRITQYATMADKARDALAINRLEEAYFATLMMLKRQGIALDELTPVQAAQAMIRKLDQAAANTDSERKNVDEGFGRLDALNRIGSQVFGIDQGEEGTKRNYVATSAPVNYPHIWMTSWFDWVQYNASIMQQMVRNAGQALGVSARLSLDPAKGTPFKSGVRIDHLYEIEAWLSGADDGTNPDWDKGPAYGGPFVTKKLAGLRAPSWPGRVLPKLEEKDLEEAARGWALYEQHCQECHRPPVGSPAF